MNFTSAIDYQCLYTYLFTVGISFNTTKLSFVSYLTCPTIWVTAPDLQAEMSPRNDSVVLC